MNTNVERAKNWMQILASGAVEEWDAITTDDLVLHAVAMPGDNDPITGQEVNKERTRQFWQIWSSFAFTGVEAHAAADDPDLVFVTAESHATTVSGAPYRNQYAIVLRFKDGLIREHVEFFDPAPVMELMHGVTHSPRS
ncbi:nuclear transport factor 2 family protein [Streptomyces ipomoeae]|uniref:nuclear transport factor 2 family protein n=1 Tax=Streptomyces ipomoeae TaxID=103232 RepID=UPI0011477F46|nr:nuclear transport factor 2 family protein [Streptomyces ipomoeae]MDX2937661.1 nuclear transport factor 2 family protein [Streptomyces ipomoeae]TQE22782.1 hypothetical protein SipoB123_21620 [Streptomyces ipomoeae]